MPNLSLKQKIMIVVAVIGAVLIFVFQRGLATGTDSNSNPQQNTTTSEQKTEANPENAKVISTNPKDLDHLTILPTQTIEITFNLPLENIGEFKHKIEPKTDYKLEISLDKKTVKIIPNKPFNLGTEYTLTIQSVDSKFDKQKRLDHDYQYHFKTIEYQGA